MLCGLALENALKGLIVANGRAVLDDQIRWTDIGDGGHNLLDLCNKNHLQITENDQEFLGALTQAILWTGRYPVPKHHANKPDFGIPLGPYLKGKLDLDTIVKRFADYKNSYDRLYQSIMSQYPPTKIDDETMQ